MGFTELLAGLLRGPQNSARVHVINLFKNFVMNYPPAIIECQRTEFDLERLLSSISKSSMEDDPVAHEVNIAIFLLRNTLYLLVSTISDSMLANIHWCIILTCTAVLGHLINKIVFIVGIDC